MPSIEIDADTSVIWHLLLDHGFATEAQLEDAYEDTQILNKPFLTLLYNYNIIKEEEMLKLIADDLGTEVFTFKNNDVDTNVIDMVKPDTARFYGIVPVKLEGDVLWVVAREPLNNQLTDELPFVLEREVRVYV